MKSQFPERGCTDGTNTSYLSSMLIFSSLFKGKNKKEAPQKGQPKPFTAEPNNPVKKIKEMSREMVKELQKEMQNECRRTAKQANAAINS